MTREFVRAINSAVPAADVRSDFGALDKEPSSFDRINVIVRADSDASNRELVVHAVQALNGVATRHRLSQDEPLESWEGPRYAYRRGNVITHEIHFHEQITRVSEKPPAPRAGETGKLAIILDDLGSDRRAAEAIFAIPYPLTISVLPQHAHSAEIAEEAHRRGFQLMLHMPMQSVGNEKPESQELHEGMSSNDVGDLVAQWLQEVPDVAGVNNHQGSQSTADTALMDELMPVLREHRLFYVDSRTTTATVAYDEAQRAGVRSAFRNVPFLDDVAEVGAVRKQLQLALRGARDKGQAIAIGHPHAATLEALRDVLPQAKSQGVNLVFVSELVH